MNRWRKGCLWSSILLALLAIFPFAWRTGVERYYGRHIYTVAEVPTHSVAIVFGAAVRPDGRLSTVLRDRVDTAIRLYSAGTVEKLLLSGDNRTTDYNEPAAMMAYAIAQGVPAADIQPDYGGRRTYDTCYRARHVFQVESAVLVTQDFHLPRALFTCRQLGIESVGVAADLRSYRGKEWYDVREMAATLVALWDTIRQRPAPVLGDPIPID